MAESNADVFIQLYKEFESIARINYGLKDWDSVIGFLAKKKEYEKFWEQLKYCRDIRNLLQHSQKIDGAYPVIPSDEAVDLLKNIVEAVKNRKMCKEIMIPMGRVFYKRLSDKVIKTLPAMRNYSHNHVPVLGPGGKVVGVFTAVSFLRLMADKGDDLKNSNITFKDIPEYISFNHHNNEAYRFVSGDSYVDDVRDMFEELYLKGIKLSMVFITGNGKSSGRLMGIITPWDVLGKELP